MKAGILVGAIVGVLAAACSSIPEGLLLDQAVIMAGAPPFCDREQAATFSQPLTADQELRLGTENRVLVTAPAGAVAQGEEITITMNLHSSSSFTFDLFVEGMESYTFNAPLTIRINTAPCRNVAPNSHLIQVHETGQRTVTLVPQNGNSRVFTGTVNSLSLFLLASPG